MTGGPGLFPAKPRTDEPAVINFVTALPSEARPLVDHFRLQRRAGVDGMTIYESGHIRLAVSGVGKVASAGAVGYLAGSADPAMHQIWINVGIAGHGREIKGTVGIAHAVRDAATGKTFYPAITFAPPCPSYAVTCFDHPTTSYDGDALCDMESAGFYPAANRFSSVEFVHVLKVVSDNSAADLQTITRERITGAIAAQMGIVQKLTDALLALSARTFPAAPGIEIEALLETWRFSATERVQLRELARRWAILKPQAPWPPASLKKCRDAGEALRTIRTELDELPAGTWAGSAP